MQLEEKIKFGWIAIPQEIGIFAETSKVYWQKKNQQTLCEHLTIVEIDQGQNLQQLVRNVKI